MKGHFCARKRRISLLMVVSGCLAGPATAQVIELRQYELEPGQREKLVELFETHFIESQERYATRIIGHFADAKRSDRFVWLRGFPDHDVRLRALQAFYEEDPVWAQHRDEANTTMRAWDNVLLLKPAWMDAGFQLDVADRPSLHSSETSGGVIVATLYHLEQLPDADFIRFFRHQVIPVLQEAGAHILATLITDPRKNEFPSLPVRENARVLAWFASFPNHSAYEQFRDNLARNEYWIDTAKPRIKRRLAGAEETLELVPTRRSLLRHR